MIKDEICDSNCTPTGAVTIMRKTMRKRIIYILLCTLACTYACAQSFCHLVQPVGTYYSDTLPGGETYYFSAMTFDLPMDVSFTSLDATCSQAPQIWADLTCTPGYYSDPKMRELIQDTAKYGLSVPMSVTCETDFIDGHYVHHMKVGKSYRNRLQLVGIDYNVPAYIKIVLPCTSVALIEQDTSSTACLNDSRRMQLVDSTQVLAYDTLSTYIFPYKDWLKEADSVALYWDGPQAARIWVAGDECEFIADVQHTWDYYDIPANGEYHLSKSMMQNAAENGTQDTAGFLYAHVVCPEEGQLYTRPLTPDLHGATLFRMNQAQTVTIADSAYYCFPKDWTSVEWVANTRKIVKAYLYAFPDTVPVDSFKFDLRDSAQRVLQWSQQDMKSLRAKATSALLYLRFTCSREQVKITPYDMNDNACLNTTVRVHSGVPLATGRSYVYRFYYEDWKDYPMEIRWTTSDASKLQNLFIADICSFETNYRNSNTKNHTVYYCQTARGGQTWTVDSTTIAGWAARITPEGYFYIRSTADGTITFTTAKPEEQDPEGDDPDEQEPGTPTGGQTLKPDTECRKVLHNGQIYIIRAGRVYTLTGQACTDIDLR